MKKASYLLLLSLIILTVSCSKENPKNISEDEITAISSDLKVSSKSSISNGDNKSFPIVIATLWRKKYNCRRLGICEWFPDFNNSELSEREVRIDFVLDPKTNNLNPLIVQLDQDPTGLPEEAIEFWVDEEMYIDKGAFEEFGFKGVVIKEGLYKYNPTIGKFGGYIIPLIGVK